MKKRASYSKFQKTENLTGVILKNQRKLTTAEEFRKHVQSNVLDRKDTKERTKSIANTLIKSSKDKLGKDKKANKEHLSVINSKGTEELLASYFEKAKKSGVDMDYSTLVESALDERKAPLALKEILQENPSLRKVLEALKQGKDEQVTSSI